MTQKHLNKWSTFLILAAIVSIVLAIIFSKEENLNYKNKMKDLNESNEKAQSKIDSALAIIVKNNLEKIELTHRLDSLNNTSQRLDKSLKDVKSELNHIKNYRDLGYDSLYKIVKGRL